MITRVFRADESALSLTVNNGAPATAFRIGQFPKAGFAFTTADLPADCTDLPKSVDPKSVNLNAPMADILAAAATDDAATKDGRLRRTVVVADDCERPTQVAFANPVNGETPIVFALDWNLTKRLQSGAGKYAAIIAEAAHNANGTVNETIVTYRWTATDDNDHRGRLVVNALYRSR